MAKITKVDISGKIGNLVFYPVNGKTRVRTQADDVKLTEATKRSAKDFGKVVKVSKYLRQGLAQVIPKSAKKWPEYLVNDAVSKSLPALLAAPGVSQDNPPGLVGLEFNEKSGMYHRLKAPLLVDWSQPGQVILNIPAMNPVRQIQAIARTQQVHWKIAVGGSLVGEPMITGGYATTLDLDYVDALLPARSIALPFTVQPGSLNAVVLSMQYSVLKKGILRLTTDQRWLPSGIIAAWYQGT
ncbi:MAG TPA: hypothetical protein VGM41_20690 [Chitinophagaceae bacterium]